MKTLQSSHLHFLQSLQQRRDTQMSALQKKVAGRKYWQPFTTLLRQKLKIMCHKGVHISEKNLWERWSPIPLLDCSPCMSKNNVSPPKCFRNATLQVSSKGRCPSSGELTVFQRNAWNPAQIHKPLLSCFSHLPSSRYPHA